MAIARQLVYEWLRCPQKVNLGPIQLLCIVFSLKIFCKPLELEEKLTKVIFIYKYILRYLKAIAKLSIVRYGNKSKSLARILANFRYNISTHQHARIIALNIHVHKWLAKLSRIE